MKGVKHIELFRVYELIVVDQAYSTSAVVALKPLQTMSAVSWKKEHNKILEISNEILYRFTEPIMHRSNVSFLYIFSTQKRLKEPIDENMFRQPDNGFRYMQLWHLQISGKAE
jgi:hypothetical protein